MTHLFMRRETIFGVRSYHLGFLGSLNLFAVGYNFMGVAIESIHGYIYSAVYTTLYRAPIDGSAIEPVTDNGKMQVYNINTFDKGMLVI